MFLARMESLSCAFLLLQQPTEAVGGGSVGHALRTDTLVDDAHAHVSADAHATRRHVQQPQRPSPSRSLEDTAPGVPGSGRQFHVLQVRKKPRDTPREDVLGYVLGMHASFRI